MVFVQPYNKQGDVHFISPFSYCSSFLLYERLDSEGTVPVIFNLALDGSERLA